jgi:hypothetical protein
MPGFDRTGPNSEGSQTGRGLGKCNPDTKENLNNYPNNRPGQGRGRRFTAGDVPGAGRGLGRGRGVGRGAGRLEYTKLVLT